MTAATGPVVVVGYTMAMLRALDTFMPDDSVVFVDEPTVARKRDAHTYVGQARATTGLLEWEYQLPAAADRFYHRHRDLDPVAVIPGVEYSVRSRPGSPNGTACPAPATVRPRCSGTSGCSGW